MDNLTYTLKTTKERDFYSSTERADIRIYHAGDPACHVRFVTVLRDGCVQREVCWHAQEPDFVDLLSPGAYSDPGQFTYALERKHNAKQVTL